MYKNYYSLAFNPFDKQQLPEKDCFRSRDFEEMTARLDFLKDTRGIGLFTASDAGLPEAARQEHVARAAQYFKLAERYAARI